MDSNDVRAAWADRSGEYSPTYYAHYGPDETSELVRATIERYAGRDARVLEVGCGVGRHLAALAEGGFSALSGVDVNADALAVLRETYPGLASVGEFHAASIEEYVEGVETDAVDAVFSVETLQHIHPDAEWVFAELARITGDLLVTVENESGEAGTVNHVDDQLPLYYRDWRRVFTDLGFEEVESVERKRDTMRVFRAGD
ncbi:class I SAM-dependent methyltransferase [Haloarcula onubensis]|uniref:Class I SAM-dependent methyltransferase n=1 Tax=Haloarcula onubensis TaxID=2950539 RepID=A0ABU2FQ34_9EURY|nr:class I SAM-dependent methyltransferase [Halomicroarcula sp. S3CR25-11]MDS0282865.1 class I SAM-dependent methyltransferase [Halomicroarcula sp. S3CR25-11]